MISTCAKCGNKLSKNSTRCKKCKTQSNDLQLNTKKTEDILREFWRKFRERPILFRYTLLGVSLVFWLLVSSVLTVLNPHGHEPSSPPRPEKPAYAMFTKVGGTVDPGGNGEVDFLLIKPARTKNLFRLRTACRAYADKYENVHANLFVWSDPKMVATQLPLSDEQTQALIAKYIRNSDSKLDAFYVYDRGASRLFDEVDTSD